MFREGTLELVVVAALCIAGCNPRLAPERLARRPRGTTHAVTITAPASLTSVPVQRAPSGELRRFPGPGGSPGSDPRMAAQELRVQCKTCHSTQGLRAVPASPRDLDMFHVGLVFQHGTLQCTACHQEGQPPQLHLATGEAIETADAMRLCAQCHGPQWRDYQHGAHGGMTGHWDLAQGPRERRNCVACHDPHAPKYIGGMPVHPPRDRFLPPPAVASHP